VQELLLVLVVDIGDEHQPSNVADQRVLLDRVELDRVGALALVADHVLELERVAHGARRVGGGGGGGDALSSSRTQRF
tara:strand:+ start:5307 stop:5540 length:234 start_codon:yes stop_codon:yes gene_type:complete